MLASSPHWTLTLSPRRAGGRYESRFRVGEVTCLDAADLPLLHLSLKSPSMTLERAGLFPTFDLMYMYSRSHPNRGFYQILVAFRILQWERRGSSQYTQANIDQVRNEWGKFVVNTCVRAMK